MPEQSLSCPLCLSPSCDAYHQDQRRQYFQCQQCQLVFADPIGWPTADMEKAEYDLHENNLEDDGYNRFLSRIVAPLHQRLSQPAEILDFGCGPAPALARQLEQQGHTVALYDTFYYPDKGKLSRQYDAIVTTEVIEHLHRPAEVTRLWWQLLRPKGVLAIMTQRVRDRDAFSRWQYKNDPTHVCFYSEQTFEFLAETLQATLEYEGRDMVFLTKPPDE